MIKWTSEMLRITSLLETEDPGNQQSREQGCNSWSVMVQEKGSRGGRERTIQLLHEVMLFLVYQGKAGRRENEDSQRAFSGSSCMDPLGRDLNKEQLIWGEEKNDLQQDLFMVTLLINKASLGSPPCPLLPSRQVSPFWKLPGSTDWGGKEA